GGQVYQETRSFDAVNGIAFTLRDKEDAHDYRYFPEPDLQPLSVTQEEIDAVKVGMPPLPRVLFEKYTSQLKLSEYDANLIIDAKPIALYFEELITLTNNYKAAANWMMGEIKSHLNHNAIDIDSFPLPPKRIAELIELIDKDLISSSSAAQQLFPKMIEYPEKSPKEIANSENLLQKSDDDWLLNLAKQALDKYPEKVEAYKNGNKG